MIGSLSGVVAYRDSSYLLIEVNGVGYKVIVPSNVVAPVGSSLKFFTHTHVREDVLEFLFFNSCSIFLLKSLMVF